MLFEATASGIPVVVADTGGLREYFGPDAVNFYRVGDASALGDAIAEVLFDLTSYDRKAKLARELLLSRELRIYFETVYDLRLSS